jgi:hypothetical protein
MQLYSLFFVEDVGDVDNPLSYNMFANKCVDTIDSYGLAFTLLFWLSNASKFLEFGGEKHKEFVLEFRACLYEMISPWLTVRSSIDVSIVKFEQLLEKSGILEKHHKKIVNHTIMDKDARIAKKDKPVLVKLPKVSKKTRALDLFGEMDPPQCPEGKEMNPKTTRCVKVCKEGYARNEQFKCLKRRSQKEEKNKEKKDKNKDKKTVKISLNSKRSRCPNGSRKNPKTGNCEKY